MKRKLEEDTYPDKQINQSPYLASKVKEYHLVFHILCGLIDTLSKDVAFAIGQYYYHLWSKPENALEAHQVVLPSITDILNVTSCKAVLVNSVFSDIDPHALTMTVLHIYFDQKGRYTIKHIITTREQLYRTDNEYRANYIYVRVESTVKKERRGKEFITAFVCVDNEILERKLESLGHIIRANRIVSYKSNPSWRTDTSLADVIFQFHKPILDVKDDYFMNESTVLLCQLQAYRCHVSLQPYRICYENDNITGVRSLLYLLTVVLDDYKNGSKDRFVSNK